MKLLAYYKGLSHRKRIVLVLIILLLLITIACFLFALRLGSGINKAVQGNLATTLLNPQPLQQDDNGITNVLIFGNSSDDPGHSGALLADSIMVLRVNQKTKAAQTVSIPRDLWVRYDTSCSNGTEGKINAVYQCALKNNGGQKDLAARNLANTVGDILGIPIQYYVEVNYTFVRDIVDALGGIDVTIHSKDPRGILDRNFDTKCPDGPYTCYFVKYANGPAHLDGQHALYLSRARNAKGGYGLPASNFDREANQQMIVRAIQKKALSVGVFTNPIRLVNLSDSLGNNIVTNIQTSELQSVVTVLKTIHADTIQTIPLNNQDSPLVTTGSQAGQSIVLPTAGLYDYSAIRSTIRNQSLQ